MGCTETRAVSELLQVLADWRGEAAVLRKHGAEPVAVAIERVCEAVAAAAEPFTTFLSEPDAKLRSGKSAGWLRTRFADWERAGFAKSERGQRYYLECVVPMRVNVGAARAAGRRAAHREDAA